MRFESITYPNIRVIHFEYIISMRFESILSWYRDITYRLLQKYNFSSPNFLLYIRTCKLIFFGAKVREKECTYKIPLPFGHDF